MRCSKLLAMLFLLGLVAAGCGWRPPSAPQAAQCGPADGPTAETIAAEISRLPDPPLGQQWKETSHGHTNNCRLHWVLVSVSEPRPDSPQQVLFFDRNTPIGTPTPAPRPYISVSSLDEDTATVQYQWRQGSDEPCCPTGVAQVRFRIGEDGKLNALDPIPNQ